MRRVSGARTALVLGSVLMVAACGSLGPQAGTWTNDDGATVTVEESGRVTFENIPYFDTSESCTEPVQFISGAGRNVSGGEYIDLILDDPIDLDPLGESRQVNIIFFAAGPGWDVWREIGISACDTDSPVVRLQRAD